MKFMSLLVIVYQNSKPVQHINQYVGQMAHGLMFLCNSQLNKDLLTSFTEIRP